MFPSFLMMKMIKGLTFLFFLQILFIPEVYSQDFCAQKLSQAEDKFDQGNFYEIPDMLSLCLNNGFTKEEKVRAYRLLTITYLYLDFSTKADESYLSLLNLSPEYRINEETDPKELLYHHEKFTTRPHFYLSVKAGFNVSDYFIINNYSLTGEGNNKETIKRSVGYNFNLGGEITLLKNLHLAIEGNLTHKGFEYSSFQLSSINANKGHATELNQVYTTIELPLYLKYSFYKPKISPFVLGGFSPSYLIMASSVNQTGSVVGEQISRDYPNFDITDARRKINYSLLAGAGIKYKLGINFLTCEVRYQMAMLNYVKRDSRFDTSLGAGESSRFGLLYVDDDFMLNNLSVMFGFTYPIYKPRKIAK